MKDYTIPNIRRGANHYDLHCLVKQLYPTEKALFRVEGNGLRVRSQVAPQGDITFLEQEIYIPEEGETVGFELTVNAAKKNRNSKQRKSIYPNDTALLDQWLVSRSIKWGFDPVSFELEAEMLYMDRQEKFWEINSTTYCGILTVENKALFVRALYEGCSHAKAFGFGLLVVNK